MFVPAKPKIMEVVNASSETDNLFRTLTDAIARGQEKPRNYNGTQKLTIPYTARFKMKIWYRDGNCRTYFSYDNIQSQNGNRIDEFEGLKKLIRLGHVHHKDDVKTLVIWATDNPTAITSSAYDFEVFKVTFRGSVSRNIGFRNLNNNSVIYKFEQLENKEKKLG